MPAAQLPAAARGALLHSCAVEDGYRWKKHLAPYFAHLRPSDVDDATIRAYVMAKLAECVTRRRSASTSRCPRRSSPTVAYAIGALAGLRTGEGFALHWRNVDLDTQRIHVRESVNGR